MNNYSNKILIDLIGSTNFFQYNNEIFSHIYKSTAYKTIMSKIVSHVDKYIIEIEEDLNYINCEDYFIKISDSDSHNHCKKVIFINDLTNNKSLVYKSKHILS